jgi:hypothetical protein
MLAQIDRASTLARSKRVANGAGLFGFTPLSLADAEWTWIEEGCLRRLSSAQVAWQLPGARNGSQLATAIA